MQRNIVRSLPRSWRQATNRYAQELETKTNFVSTREHVALAEAAVSLDDFGKVVGLDNQTTKTPLPFGLFQQYIKAHFHLYYEYNNATALLEKHQGTIAAVVR